MCGTLQLPWIETKIETVAVSWTLVSAFPAEHTAERTYTAELSGSGEAATVFWFACITPLRYPHRCDTTFWYTRPYPMSVACNVLHLLAQPCSAWLMGRTGV